jgi:hypothetical protein
MEEMLIEKVRQRTFLYETQSPDYRAYQHIDVMNTHFSPDSHCVGC